MINEYILVYLYIHLIAWIFICDRGFDAALLRQSLGKEKRY